MNKLVIYIVNKIVGLLCSRERSGFEKKYTYEPDHSSKIFGLSELLKDQPFSDSRVFWLGRARDVRAGTFKN